MDNAALEQLVKPRIEKVVVNCSVGEGGAKLEKAMKIIESLVGQKPEVRKAKKTIRGFGIHRGEPIAIRATLRKQAAVDFLRKALAAVNNRIKSSSIDKDGNFSFGIKEHLDIPGTRYNPELGIVGMDVTVHLSKPGYRVWKRAYRPSKVGKRQRVSKDETLEFLKSLGVEVIEE
ncbi:MAG: 50S ribosomal protein L5 [Candidatus Caldarchaeum sp.]|nr:50S ribosomal protein L5 [Candidatus Caldarchaeum sp.]MCX8201034.1 50S ribosomal protein L5 [Candidatus Caldarchaeum sp.]MDW8063669.1 50S ribosomal protein L5 [Candidatus Caldarchaeum sp.]MDW8435456.1 50S ribosomal protein L5 [Candidatus Caldarchaeum sp.]